MAKTTYTSRFKVNGSIWMVSLKQIKISTKPLVRSHKYTTNHNKQKTLGIYWTSFSIHLKTHIEPYDKG